MLHCSVFKRLKRIIALSVVVMFKESTIAQTKKLLLMTTRVQRSILPLGQERDDSKIVASPFDVGRGI